MGQHTINVHKVATITNEVDTSSRGLTTTRTRRRRRRRRTTTTRRRRTTTTRRTTTLRRRRRPEGLKGGPKGP